jgi:hypothetical protein
MLLTTKDKTDSNVISPNEMAVGDVGTVVAVPKTGCYGFLGEVIFRTTSGWHTVQNGSRYWPAAGYGFGNTSHQLSYHFDDGVLVRLLDIGEAVPLVREK